MAACPGQNDGGNSWKRLRSSLGLARDDDNYILYFPYTLMLLCLQSTWLPCDFGITWKKLNGFLFFICEDGGSSFSAVLFYGHEFTLLVFEVLIFALVDLASHNYFLGAAVTFFIMEVSWFNSSTVLHWQKGLFGNQKNYWKRCEYHNKENTSKLLCVLCINLLTAMLTLTLVMSYVHMVCPHDEH